MVGSLGGGVPFGRGWGEGGAGAPRWGARAGREPLEGARVDLRGSTRVPPAPCDLFRHTCLIGRTFPRSGPTARGVGRPGASRCPLCVAGARRAGGERAGSNGRVPDSRCPSHRTTIHHDRTHTDGRGLLRRRRMSLRGARYARGEVGSRPRFRLPASGSGFGLGARGLRKTGKRGSGETGKRSGYAVRRRSEACPGGPQVGLPPGRPCTPALPMERQARARPTAQPRARRRVAASGAGR